MRLTLRTARILTALWAILTVIMVWMCISALTGPGARTTLTCERAKGTCTLDGATHEAVPNVADLASAEDVVQRQHGEGDAHYLTLVHRDGTKQNLSAYGAVDEASIADITASVAAINAFLGDTSKSRVATTFEVRSSTFQKIRSIVYALMTLAILGLLISRTRPRRASAGA